MLLQEIWKNDRLIYEKSKRFIAERTLSIQTGQKRVGVFVQATIEEIQEFKIKHHLDYAQLHGDESPDICAKVKEFIPIIKVFRVDENFEWNSTEEYKNADYFLFDTRSSAYGGTGRKFDWDQLVQYTGNVPFFLSGGIGPDDVERIKKVQHPQFAGVDINSKFEESPGVKKTYVIEKFILELRN